MSPLTRLALPLVVAGVLVTLAVAAIVQRPESLAAQAPFSTTIGSVTFPDDRIGTDLVGAKVSDDDRTLTIVKRPDASSQWLISFVAANRPVSRLVLRLFRPKSNIVMSTIVLRGFRASALRIGDVGSSDSGQLEEFTFKAGGSAT
jgi:hypothetical protein